MNNIRKLGIAAFILLISLSLSTAQRGRRNVDPEQIAERQTTHMVDQLSLNEEQAAELKAVNLKYAEKFEEMHAGKKGREQMREAMLQLRDEKDAEIKSILTEEQYQQWQEMRPAPGPRPGMGMGKGKGQGRRGAAVHPGQRADRAAQGMIRQLDLNDEQAAQVKTLNQKFAQQRQELQQQEMEPADRRAAFEELRTEHEAELKKVLTEEQYQQWLEERPAPGIGGRGPGMGPGPGNRAEAMIDHLGLEGEQAEKIQAIHDKYTEQMQTLRAETEPGDRRGAFQELRREMEAELKEVLTEEQYQLWLEERPGPGNGRRGGQKGRR